MGSSCGRTGSLRDGTHGWRITLGHRARTRWVFPAHPHPLYGRDCGGGPASGTCHVGVHRSSRRRRRRVVGVVIVAVTLVVAIVGSGGFAGAATNPDRDVAWSGGVAARSVPIPGSEGGFRSTVVGSFRLWVPSGGTWQVESALTATGVRKADAPGSAYGRVSFGHAVECGPDTRDVAGRLTTPVLTTVSGTNLLYDRTTTTTVRGLWRAVRGYNRCQVVVIVGRDDLAVAGKRFTLNGGYVRLVGRGLADGQTTSIQMSPRMLSRSAPSLTAPNFQTYYTAPSRLAVAGNAQLTPAVRFVDVVADAYVTTCYGPGSRTVTPILRADGTVVATRLACPVSAGVLTPVTYQSMAVVQQYHSDGTLCRQTTSPMRSYSTTGVVHHQEVRNRIIVAVDATCSSRRFRAKLFLRWTSGNAFWVEGGDMSRVTVRPLAS